ncbi:hypothetical protein BC628DRAFT_1357957 [Trametes gibbosa]|nr:hypothetical protein BC628DRAFT_1357957 [Trametes gibbosa]
MKKGSKAARTRTPLAAPGAAAHLLTTATREQISQYAMLHSMATGTFEDVKFYLFSRRKDSGVVYAPRPLFANSALICKTSPHFDFVFAAGFAESEASDMDAPFPPDRAPQTQDYDYSADSDLERDNDDDDDDDGDGGGDDARNVTDHGERQQVTTPSPARTRPRFLWKDSESVDVLTDDRSAVASKLASLKQPGPELPSNYDIVEVEKISPPSPAVAVEISRDDRGEPQAIIPVQPRRKGRVVFIEDIAYRTWESFVFYAYFGRVAFAPLSSQPAASPTARPKYEPPPCSPKSMYRLADKYGIEGLKQLALEDLRSKMLQHNILVELLSPFSFTYTSVQEMELAYLVDNLKGQEVYQQLPKWVQALEEGHLPCDTSVVLSKALVRVLSQKCQYCRH